MKNLSILKQFMAIGALLLIVTSCGKKEIETDASLQPTDDEYVDTSIEVATIQKDGHEYQFIALGEEGEMVIIENLYGLAAENYEDTGIADDATPYDVFMSLTNEDVKVPLHIAATVDESVIAASNREIAESPAHLMIEDPNYSTEIMTEDRGCYDVGWTNFFETYCGGQSSYYSLPQERKFCDRGLKIVLARDSRDLKCKKVKTWTNSVCGNTLVTVWRSRDAYSGGPLTKKYQKSFPNGIWYLNYYSSTYEYFRVHRTVTSNNTNFRAWTKFTKW